ncbi:sigma-E factor regulatory protein RseB domain-containing protein [Streptomyces syringium]|uniref:LolA family protein n=1 Tax=Streptomyces syringium TaxID=76729 RepID=UPI00343D655B
MARIQPTQGADEAGTPGTGRRKAARYVVPVAVAGVAAATIGFVVPALASTGDPDLPKISAQDLIAKMAKSDVQQASGTVKISTDLGLPSLPSGFSLGDAGKGSGGGKGGDAADPQAKLTELLSGSHTLRIAVDGPDKQRLSIVERAAEYSVIRNGDDVWAYDSASDAAHHSKAPKQGGDGHEVPKDLAGVSPQELAKRALAAVDDTTSVTVDGTAKVAGRDAYQLVIKPKGGDSTVGAVRIAVDAKNGVPLKFTLAPKSGKAIVDAGFTKVDFGKPAAKNFTFTPSKGTKVTEDSGKPGKGDGAERLKGKLPGAGELPGLTGLPGLDGASDASGMKVIGKGWSSIAEIKGPKDAVGKLSEDAKGKGKGGDAAALLDSFGKKVSGDFGSGRVFSTRIVNVLMTDDGRVYAGAVTKDALVKAANSAK